MKQRTESQAGRHQEIYGLGKTEKHTHIERQRIAVAIEQHAVNLSSDVSEKPKDY